MGREQGPVRQKIAIGSRLKGIENVLTLGAKPNVSDYPDEQLELLLAAPRVYYPTPLLVHEILSLGKEVFPSLSTYHCAGDKIRQTRMFALHGVPHPRTRVFYPGHHHLITSEFPFPFVAKVPRGKDSGRGVFLVRNREELDRYLESVTVAYIQEYLPADSDIRVVVIQGRVVLAYWRRGGDGFRHNVSKGAVIDFDDVPGPALALARRASVRCGFNDVGVDILVHQGHCLVLEVNMRFGRRAFRQTGISLKSIYEEFLEKGII